MRDLIAELKAFDAGYVDGGGTLVGVRTGDQTTQVLIPQFNHPGERDNQGSENHKRYLAVETAIGKIDTDAIQSEPKSGGP